MVIHRIAINKIAINRIAINRIMTQRLLSSTAINQEETLMDFMYDKFPEIKRYVKDSKSYHYLPFYIERKVRDSPFYLNPDERTLEGISKKMEQESG